MEDLIGLRISLKHQEYESLKDRFGDIDKKYQAFSIFPNHFQVEVAIINYDQLIPDGWVDARSVVLINISPKTLRFLVKRSLRTNESLSVRFCITAHGDDIFFNHKNHHSSVYFFNTHEEVSYLSFSNKDESKEASSNHFRLIIKK